MADDKGPYRRPRNDSWPFAVETDSGFVRAYPTWNHARRGLRLWRLAFPDMSWRVRRYPSRKGSYQPSTEGEQ